MIRKELESLISKALTELNLPQENLVVEVSDHADFATNYALRLGKTNDYQNPMEIAKVLVANLPKSSLVSSVEIAGPGFLNFHLNHKEVANFLSKVLDDAESYGQNDLGKDKKARIELVSANPTGPLHLGNARGGPIGDVLANVLKASSYSVIKEFYDNNIGTQVDIFGQSLLITIKRKLGKQVSAEEKVAYEGSYLDELSEQLISRLNLSSKEDLDSELELIKREGIKTLFEEIIADSRALGIEFDELYHEEDIQKDLTQKVINTLKEGGYTKESEGALWFAPNDGFLEDKEAVLERSESRRPTYFADDVAYHALKFKDDPDLVFNVLGSNHHSHVTRILAAIKALDGDPSRYHAILYQYVRVKRGSEIVKMSKRAGNFITAREVLEEAGRDAFRFFMLMHSPNTHMDFDLELAQQKNNENPVFYVQYAHARMNSILEKGPDLEEGANLELLISEEEFTLIKKLLQLPDLIMEISQNFAVHQLSFYAMEIADLFHRFYETHKVISEDPEMTQARLVLVKATKIALKNTLSLLGVSSPDHM